MRDNRSVKVLRWSWLLLGTTSCTTCAGLDDIEYVDTAPSTTSAGATATASSGSDGAASSSSASTATTTSTASTSSAGGGGAGGDEGTGGAGGEGVGGIGGEGGECVVAADERSDDFEVDGLDEDKWTPLEDAPGLVSQEVSNGRLRMESFHSQWYEDGPGGPFIYQVVNEDFIMWTRIRVTQDGVIDPTESYHGGGLLIREPQVVPGDTESFFMVSSLIGEPAGMCRLAVTTDEEGVSSGVLYADVEPDCTAYLALCRSEGLVYLYVRELDSDTWLPLDITGLSPFPQLEYPLQVGPAVFSLDGEENTVGEFEFVEFFPTCGLSCDDLVQGLEE